jgi:hypothetical protein
MRPWICRRHRNPSLPPRLLGQVGPGVSQVSVQQQQQQQKVVLGSEGREDGKMAQGHRSPGSPVLKGEGERLYAEQEWWHAVQADVGWRSE